MCKKLFCLFLIGWPFFTFGDFSSSYKSHIGANVLLFSCLHTAGTNGKDVNKDLRQQRATKSGKVHPLVTRGLHPIKPFK